MINIFDFNESDLRANQRGLISPRQKEWLGVTAGGIRSFSWKSALVAVFFLCLGLGMIMAIFLQNERSRAVFFSNPMNLIALPATALVVLLILALSILLARRQANRIIAAQLQSVEGNVHLDETSDGDFTSYHVFVGNKKFSFGDDASNYFREGEKYKVYYCKSGIYEFVLSFECIDH
ncbi:MAG TPA: hypothetical protein VK249_22290 [Anaerolineales bacterium]|nr:hypothetical protein [Anaerolineales bacterium]